MHVFGIKVQGKKYVKRQAVYGILQGSFGQIGVVRKRNDQLLLLPGGGIENEETELECLEREILEETGYAINKPAFLCEAIQYFQSRDGSHYIQNLGSFYSCLLGMKEQEPVEEDHELVWLTPEEAANGLFHQHQAWAVRQYFGLLD
ncbi:NUDIX domain-containing protein [Terribacillus saccharophilus]|uniref:NUDIX domain-containing protein n=1 Tax=Terribacillus saccharophilus TaxID=361277 RepID=UPI0039821BB9